MNVKPKFVYYDIRRKQSVCLIMYTHENDVDTQVLEVNMLDNGEPIELDTNYTYSAAIVNRDTKALINDNISCELNDSGNVLIPIDNFHTLGAQDLLIELTITDSAGNQVLVTPFPLWIHVNASILDDAQVTPESQGTVPELLEDAEKALEDAQQAIEDAGDYENLGHKPQINGHELVGNKSSDDLGLQGKLTAGENITINANGEISASGGVTINQTAPQIFSGSQYPYEVGDLFLYNQKIYRFRETHTVHLIGKLNLFDKIGRRIVFSYSNPPQSETTRAVSTYDSGDLFVIRDRQAINSQGRLIGQDVYLCVDVLYTGTSDNKMHYTYTWQKIRVEDISKIISSATVNQNGTITFTMSDGSTVTTTGESVIGPQGDDYVLTPQDKTDIANIVLSELPTTQGVLYGN